MSLRLNGKVIAGSSSDTPTFKSLTVTGGEIHRGNETHDGVVAMKTLKINGKDAATSDDISAINQALTNYPTNTQTDQKINNALANYNKAIEWTEPLVNICNNETMNIVGGEKTFTINDTTISDLPIAKRGIVQTRKNILNNRVVQIYFCSETSDNDIYYRYLEWAGTRWANPVPWQKIYGQTDLLNTKKDLLSDARWQNGYLYGNETQTATNEPQGEQSSTQLEITSNAIEITEGKYIFSIKSPLPTPQQFWLCVGLYYADGSINSRPSKIATSTCRNLDYEFTVPDNIKYLRVSYRTFGNCICELHKI